MERQPGAAWDTPDWQKKQPMEGRHMAPRQMAPKRSAALVEEDSAGKDEQSSAEKRLRLKPPAKRSSANMAAPWSTPVQNADGDEKWRGEPPAVGSVARTVRREPPAVGSVTHAVSQESPAVGSVAHAGKGRASALRRSAQDSAEPASQEDGRWLTRPAAGAKFMPPQVAAAPRALHPEVVPRVAHAEDVAATDISTAAATAIGEQRREYLVITYANDETEVGISALLGEYTTRGTNHGRQVFQKTKPLPGAVILDVLKGVDVLLYYWDHRNGDPFEGWWFGNKLGGSQVWAHSKSDSQLPPSDGWRVPWNGPVRHTLSVVDRDVHMKAESEEKYRFLLAEVQRAEADADKLMAQVKSIGDGDGCHDPEQAAESQSAEGLAQAESLLGQQASAIAELITKALECKRMAVSDHVRHLQDLGDQIQKLHNTVNAEFSRVRALREKGEREALRREQEEKDTAMLEEFLAEATEKTNTAEDMVEKASIAGEMIDMITASGDDAESVQTALAQTAQAAKAAQTAIGEARIYLNAKLASSRKFRDTARDKALAELGRLQQQLGDAQQKLNPLKHVRIDYEQRKGAQALFAEVEQTIASAEVDVDRAEEMLTVLDLAAPRKEGVEEAENALDEADAHLRQALDFLESKKQQKQGVVREDLKKFNVRGDAAKLRLSKLRDSLKGASEKITADEYAAEAGEKVKVVSDAIDELAAMAKRLEERELPLADLAKVVQVADLLVASCSSKAAQARTFLQMKALEVKRHLGGVNSEASKNFQSYRRKLDEAAKQLNELKQSVTRQRRLALVREAGVQVEEIEQLVDLMKQAGSTLSDDANLIELTNEEIREATEKTAVAEKNASERILEVKQELTRKQIEAKGRDASSEVGTQLMKFQTRLTTAQAEVGKQRKLYSTIEKRIASVRLVREASEKLNDAESKVHIAADLVAGLPEPDLVALFAEVASTMEANTKDVKAGEAAIAEAGATLRTASRFVESQMRSAGSAKEALAKLETRVKSTQDRLDSVSASLKDKSEKMRARSILAEAQQKVSDSEAVFQKAVDAELPFLHGQDDELEATVITEKASSVEKAVQAAQAAATAAKCKVSMNRLAAKRLPEASTRGTMEALQTMHETVEELSKKLHLMRTRCSEWKKRALQREVQSKSPLKLSSGMRSGLDAP